MLHIRGHLGVRVLGRAASESGECLSLPSAVHPPQPLDFCTERVDQRFLGQHVPELRGQVVDVVLVLVLHLLHRRAREEVQTELAGLL